MPYEDLVRRNHRYEEEKVWYYFLSEDSEGNEIELSTRVTFLWDIRPGTYSSTEDDPEMFYDLYTLVAYDVGLTKDYLTGEWVSPKKVLDSSEFARYTQGLQEFVSKYE